jgi:HEAT repeat protein
MSVAIGCSDSTNAHIAKLADPDPSIRSSAARALGSSKVSRDDVVDALAKAASDPVVEVRECAIIALGSKGATAKSSLQVLEHSLADVEASVRVAAALAIQKIEPADDAYAGVLIEALRAGHGPVFLEVSRMKPAADWAIPTLIALLSDSRASIRALAARTLGDVGATGRSVESALARSLRDNHPAVRKAAQNALERIASK